MRLNKYLADCGVASRRASEKLVQDGHVKINGRTVTDVTYAVSDHDTITVDGKLTKIVKKKYYIMLHKPKGCVTTSKDELGRKTVMDLIDIKARLFSIGRLDYDTEGLLLLTNDGDLANVLTHPKHKVSKTYVARISGILTSNDVTALQNGIVIDGKATSPAIVKILDGDSHHTRVEITIFEGRNHQIKKMFDAVGKEVEFLKRTQVGDIHLGGLTRGEYRDLNSKEIDYLKGLL